MPIPQIGGINPFIYADFVNNSYYFNGASYSTIASWLSASGVSYTNATGKYVTSSSGNLTTVAANTLPFDYVYNGTTWVPAGLLLEGGATNYLHSSNDFSTSSPTWNVGWAASAQNATGPNGVANSAWTLTVPNNSSYAGYASPGISEGIYSVYAKAGTLTYLVIGPNATPQAWFNLSTGTYAGDNGSGIIKAAITPVGNGWYRCSIALNGGSAPTIGGTNTYGNQGDVAGGTLLLWGAQVEGATGAYLGTPFPDVAYWNCDSSTINWSTPVINDQSGAGNNATPYNLTSANSVGGVYGGAINLGGVGQLIGANSSADPQSFTLALWFNTTVADGCKLIGLDNTNTDTAASIYDRMIYIGTDGYLYGGVAAGGPKICNSNANTYADGNWHHVALTYDGNNVYLYVDGVQQTSTQLGVGAAYSYTGWWHVGGYTDNGWTSSADGYSNATVDEIRVYSIPLTSAQIAQLYAGTTGSALGPTSYIPTSAGATSRAADTFSGATSFALTAETIYAAFYGLNSSDGIGRVLAINDATVSNAIDLEVAVGKSTVASGGSDQAILSPTTFGSGLNKFAVSASVTQGAIAVVNSGTPATAVISAMPTALTTLQIANGFCGDVTQIGTWPIAATAPQLSDLTSAITAWSGAAALASATALHAQGTVTTQTAWPISAHLIATTSRSIPQLSLILTKRIGGVVAHVNIVDVAQGTLAVQANLAANGTVVIPTSLPINAAFSPASAVQAQLLSKTLLGSVITFLPNATSLLTSRMLSTAGFGASSSLFANVFPGVLSSAAFAVHTAATSRLVGRASIASVIAASAQLAALSQSILSSQAGFAVASQFVPTQVAPQQLLGTAAIVVDSEIAASSGMTMVPAVEVAAITLALTISIPSPWFICCTPDTSVERLGKKATWNVNGVDTNVTVENFGNFFQLHLTGQAYIDEFYIDASFPGTELFMTPSDAWKRLVTIEPLSEAPYRVAVGPSLVEVSSQPELIAEIGNGEYDTFCGSNFFHGPSGLFMAPSGSTGAVVLPQATVPPTFPSFILPSTTDYRLFERYAVYTPDDLPTGGTQGTMYCGYGWFDFQPFTAEVDLSMPGKSCPVELQLNDFISPLERYPIPQDGAAVAYVASAIEASRKLIDKTLMQPKPIPVFSAGAPFIVGRDHFVIGQAQLSV